MNQFKAPILITELAARLEAAEIITKARKEILPFKTTEEELILRQYNLIQEFQAFAKEEELELIDVFKYCSDKIVQNGKEAREEIKILKYLNITLEKS